jgi:lysophospholipase L1-like esterase
VAYYAHDRSPYHLYYGFQSVVGRVGINPRSTFLGEFYKLPPNYVLRGAAGQREETASTNALGFRGPDFSPVKARGTFRVICLGESSTFGYKNRDDETYPFQLQQRLRRRGLPAEVINAGFPYYNTGSILSLLNAELLSYDPDLITLYAAYNDTSWPTQVGVIGRAALWVQNHSIAYLLTRDSMGSLVSKVERRVYDRAIPQKLRDQAFREDDDRVAQRYRANVRTIVDIARSRGIPLVVVTQPVSGREAGYESLTYEQESRVVREKFERGEALSEIETWMLKHRHLMAELNQIAVTEHLPIVDNIAIVDQDRRRLASWVHLTPEGNERLAEALETVIVPYIERTPSAGARRASVAAVATGSTAP